MPYHSFSWTLLCDISVIFILLQLYTVVGHIAELWSITEMKWNEVVSANVSQNLHLVSISLRTLEQGPQLDSNPFPS